MAVKKQVDWDAAFDEAIQELRVLNRGESQPARGTKILEGEADRAKNPQAMLEALR